MNVRNPVLQDEHREILKSRGISEKKKVVVIDWQSLFHTGIVLGIGRFNLRELRYLLAEAVGDLKCEEVYCVAPERNFDHGFENALEHAGFKPVSVVMARRSSDDARVIEIIQSAAPETVGEIVLVAADGGYAPYLRDKCKQGIKIFVVATEKVDPHDQSGRSRFSQDLRDSLFQFVELGDYVGDILQEPWVEEKKKPARTRKMQEQDMPKMILTFNFSGSMGEPDLEMIGVRWAHFAAKHGVGRFSVQTEQSPGKISCGIPKGQKDVSGFFLMIANFLLRCGITDFDLSGKNS